MKINGFLFLILAIGLILGSVAIYAYVQAMSPLWLPFAVFLGGLAVVVVIIGIKHVLD